MFDSNLWILPPDLRHLVLENFFRRLLANAKLKFLGTDAGDRYC